MGRRRLQDEHRSLGILLTLQLQFKSASFGHRQELPACHKLDLVTETARGVIAATLVFGKAASQIVGRTNVMATGLSPQNVNPSHEQNGSAGTRTQNQRLKRALLYRLSYQPVMFSFLQIGLAGNRPESFRSCFTI